MNLSSCRAHVARGFSLGQINEHDPQGSHYEYITPSRQGREDYFVYFPSPLTGEDCSFLSPLSLDGYSLSTCWRGLG